MQIMGDKKISKTLLLTYICKNGAYVKSSEVKVTASFVNDRNKCESDGYTRTCEKDTKWHTHTH